MKRLNAGPLWFMAFWFMYELLWSITGVPRMAGPVIGLVVAATVWIDPMHWFWPAGPKGATSGISASTLRASAK